MTEFVTRFLVSVIKCFVFQLDVQLKAAFAVVPTNNICGRSLSLKIPVISDELGKDREVFTTSGTYPWLLRIHVSFNLSAPNIQLWTFL
jgi:hypothetical protein